MDPGVVIPKEIRTCATRASRNWQNTPTQYKSEAAGSYPQVHAIGVAVGLSVVLNLQSILTWLSLLRESRAVVLNLGVE